MDELVVKIQTAELADKSGFREYCERWYVETLEHDYTDHHNGNECTFPYVPPRPCYLSHQFEYDRKLFRAPTQIQLQRWIRITHKIHIEIYCNASGWGWILTKLNGTVIKEILDDMFYKEHDDALEAGLIEALNLIK